MCLSLIIQFSYLAWLEKNWRGNHFIVPTESSTLTGFDYNSGLITISAQIFRLSASNNVKFVLPTSPHPLSPSSS